MIDLQNITVWYGKKIVVEDVSVSTPTGTFIALVGPNGSGKSSLLKAIAGLIPHEGTSSLPTDRRERAKYLSYLAQNSTAPDDRKVEDIIALGRTPFLGPLAKLSPKDKVIISEAAKACDIENFFGRKFGTLSGGDKGSTLIVALHDLKLAERFADQIWVMKSGHLVTNAPAKTALSEAVLRDVFRITPSGNMIS